VPRAPLVRSFRCTSLFPTLRSFFRDQDDFPPPVTTLSRTVSGFMVGRDVSGPVTFEGQPASPQFPGLIFRSFRFLMRGHLARFFRGCSPDKYDWSPSPGPFFLRHTGLPAAPFFLSTTDLQVAFPVRPPLPPSVILLGCVVLYSSSASNRVPPLIPLRPEIPLITCGQDPFSLFPTSASWRCPLFRHNVETLAVPVPSAERSSLLVAVISSPLGL